MLWVANLPFESDRQLILIVFDLVLNSYPKSTSRMSRFPDGNDIVQLQLFNFLYCGVGVTFIVYPLLWRASWYSSFGGSRRFSRMRIFSCLAPTCNSWFSTSSRGVTSGVTLVYREDRLDPCCIKGKLLELTPRCTRKGRKELWLESELHLLLTCGIHFWLQEVLASPQLPMDRFSHQVGRRWSAF